ncbi:GIY-YIG nuclease family protein [Mesorhizobium sp. B2-4-18]|uniref:GIY-YIG nuclease family protein n=1 Tax=Mesorhizobium sp. B2-4-18 TaxID=2589931 RepID=UPI0011284223|nr:GIY-YIG nuclease family protein [Mesorhizobium sp. B2-4-18]TPK80384.1 GIY-YIG nuclease family protein [Mesorhizobium sp. B2-4-18]
MKMFAKYFHGFDPIGWPAVTFSSEAAARSLVEEFEPGSRMVFLATKKAPIAAMRGSIVGMMEFAGERGRVEQYFSEAVIAANVREYGEFRWPWAVRALRAWEFEQPYPKTREVLGHVPVSARNTPWMLSKRLASKVLRLAHFEVPLARPVTVLQSTPRQVTGRATRRNSKGPPPTSYEALVVRSCDGPCFTYLLRFGARDIWKVGMSVDPNRRLDEINSHIPTEVLDEKWEMVQRARFKDAQTAYDVEQALLDHFHTHRTVGERIVLSSIEIATGWDTVVGELGA